MSLHSCDELRDALINAHALVEEYHCPGCALKAHVLVDDEEMMAVLAEFAAGVAVGWRVHKQLDKREKLREAFMATLVYGVLAGQALEREMTS
jgi:hypothetical protein